MPLVCCLYRAMLLSYVEVFVQDHDMYAILRPRQDAFTNADCYSAAVQKYGVKVCAIEVQLELLLIHATVLRLVYINFTCIGPGESADALR